MVHLTRLLFLRKPYVESLHKVSRRRPIAKGAEYLYEKYPNVKVDQLLDGTLSLKSQNIIRLALDGCSNRPFYRIVVSRRLDKRDSEIEQLGTFDPMPNMCNEKLCSFNFERVKYHLAMGAHPVRSVRRLLGLSGFLPLDPSLYFFAKGLKRRREIEMLKKEKEETESANEIESTEEADDNN